VVLNRKGETTVKTLTFLKPAGAELSAAQPKAILKVLEEKFPNAL
jgi:hypothetical protein